MDKKASNFELNQIKLGVNTFQLEKGDRFVDNGTSFMYHPSGQKNRVKLPFRRWNRDKSISCIKHKKDVLRADNIEIVESNHHSCTYEVKYAYAVPELKKEQLTIMIVRYDDEYEFSVVQNDIERETKELFFLKQSHPVTCLSKIEKSHLMKPVFSYGVGHIICKFDDFHEAQDILFKAVENHVNTLIKNAKELLTNREKQLVDFNGLKLKYGY